MTSTEERAPKFAFLVTSKTWYELENKLLLMHQPLRKLLNEHIDLANYGSSVENILFIFVAQKENEEEGFHEDYIQYDGERKELIIQHDINYDVIYNIPPEELKNFIALSYLQGLEKLILQEDYENEETGSVEKTFTIENFDFPKLLKHIEHLFQENDWLIAKPVEE